MKKEYEIPSAEIVVFTTQDCITISGEGEGKGADPYDWESMIQ